MRGRTGNVESSEGMEDGFTFKIPNFSFAGQERG
jgi:hypothetical protein